MAKTKKSRQVFTEKKEQIVPQPVGGRYRRWRLSAGIFFVLAGIFTSFSVLSYFVTWKTDQDKILNGGGLSSFLWKERTVVANWGGRLGAALSHVLVYRGVGIAALSIGLVMLSIGLNLIYAKRVLPLLRYLRWTSLFLLILAPLLTYTLSGTAFPLGGSLGLEVVNYLNELVGTGGTGLILLATACIFLFVVIELDLKPLFSRVRRTARRVTTRVRPEPIHAEPPMPAADTEPVQETEEREAALALAGFHMPEEEDPGPHPELEFHLIEKTAEGTVVGPVAGEEEPPFLITGQPQEEMASRLFIVNQEEANAFLPSALAETPEAEAPAEMTPVEGPALEMLNEPEPEPSELQPERPASTLHGSHISIESNEPYAPELDLPDYRFPTLDLLEDRSEEIISIDKAELEQNKNQILQTLKSFGIEIQRIYATVGPTVTLYEIVPAEGVRISKIRNLEDDIALNLAALGIRIIAPIPGKGTIGIEVPNANKQIVSMKALLSNEKFIHNTMGLPIALGKKIDNKDYIVDLATMPHLLMAGATGQGKSVGINTILVSLLFKKHPSQLKFVMVDPKKVELSIYNTIEKHFLAKLPNEAEAIITDTRKVIHTLNALCILMDIRYELLKEAGTRNIREYNDKFIRRRLNPENGHQYLPFIVLVIDEFADLIMTAGKEVEMPIARLAQLARAVGIHLIIATQRPSVNVITGTIKANFPGRMAFKVSAKVDSRTILDTGGAEQLIGRGDMLVSHGSELLRLQCAFVDTPEVERVVDFIGSQRGYSSAFLLPEYEGDDEDDKKKVDLQNRDKMFDDCARLVVQTQQGSTSNLQRKLSLGYNRAGRIMDQLEAAGIVGPSSGSKPREVYFKTEAELEQFLSELT